MNRLIGYLGQGIGFFIDAVLIVAGPRWLLAVWLVGWHVAWVVMSRETQVLREIVELEKSLLRKRFGGLDGR